MKKLLSILLLILSLVACRQERKDSQLHISRVENAYAYLKQNRSLPQDVDLLQEADYLCSHDLVSYAGQAYYIVGAYENLIGQDSLAMYHLKQAESCWQTCPNAPAALQGMTYYKQGRISENEHLPEVALFHYRRALPYLLQAGDSLYLSSVYREIGRVTTDSVERRQSFALSLRYAEALTPDLQMDTRYAILSAEAADYEARLRLSRSLCDSAHQYRYAADIVRAALSRGDLDEAERYLSKLSQDTTERLWSQHQYALLHARYLFLSGDEAAAYSELELLYHDRISMLEAEGTARSYTIAERFDNAHEREKNLQLELQQQRLTWWLTMGVVLAFLLAAVLTVTWLVKRQARQLQQARTEAHIARLDAALAEKQEQLRKMLLQRLSKTQKMANIFAGDADWQTFKDAFNAVYDNKLTLLTNQYPDLTTADLQVIALSELGLDSSDICLLLNQTKRTIWNRRQRIKQHMLPS